MTLALVGWLSGLELVFHAQKTARGFDSWSGHIPSLWVSVPFQDMSRRQPTHMSVCLSPFLSYNQYTYPWVMILNKYMTQRVWRKVDKFIVVVGNFNVSLSVISEVGRQNISKCMIGLHSTPNRVDLTAVCSTPHSTAECTFFSSAQGLFPKTGTILP